MRRLVIGLTLALLVSCNNRATEVKTCYTIKAKHMENESIGTQGDFRVIHYFLMSDGTLKKVELKDYLTYNPGEKICFSETVWVKNKK